MARTITRLTASVALTGSLPVEVLMKVRACHHGHQAGLVDLLERAQVAGAEDGLHVGGLAAGPAELGDLVVKRFPVAGQHEVPWDDYIYFARPGFDGLFDLGDALGQGGLPGGEAGCNGSDRDVRAPQRFDRILDAAGVNTDRADGDLLTVKPQSRQHIRADGLPGLGAQAPDAPGRIVAGQCGQVDAGDGAQQPGRLPVLFDGAALGQRFDPPLDRALIDVRPRDPIQVERGAGVTVVGIHS
jgi:hypothetical protein